MLLFYNHHRQNRMTPYGRQVGKTEAQRLFELVEHARVAHLLGDDGAQAQLAGGH